MNKETNKCTTESGPSGSTPPDCSVPVRSCLVPESFILAFGDYAKKDKCHDAESIKSAFKCQCAWVTLQKELIAWVEMEQNQEVNGE